MKNTVEEMAKAYRRYQAILDSIPDYINNNLREMPSNKGYIWKHVHLYGLCPAEKPFNKTVLFEKLPRQVTRIHEWTNGYYRIFRKEGKEVKTLESTEQRVKKRAKKIEPPSIDSAFPELVAEGGAPKSSASVNLWKKFEPKHDEEVEEKSVASRKYSSYEQSKLRR